MIMILQRCRRGSEHVNDHSENGNNTSSDNNNNNSDNYIRKQQNSDIDRKKIGNSEKNVALKT